jgi:tRNA(fMet)-specific endonuclease VapC
MNGKYPSVKEMFLSISPKEIKIPAVVKAELLLEAYKSQTREQTVKKVKNFLKPFEIISFTDDMTEDYAEIRAELELSGKTIGANDYFIATTVRSKKGILVTHNVGEFSRVINLEIEDWVKE